MLEYVYKKNLKDILRENAQVLSTVQDRVQIQIPNLVTPFHTARSKFVKVHHSIKAVEGEGFQHGTAGLLSKAGHAVGVAALLRPRLDVHAVGGVDGRVHVKIVVGPQNDPASVAHGDRVGDVLGVGNVEESRRHPGNQILNGG